MFRQLNKAAIDTPKAIQSSVEPFKIFLLALNVFFHFCSPLINEIHKK